MSDRLRLVTFPDPILTTPCKPFNFNSMPERELFDRAQRMIEIMKETSGIGIAAPQVGWAARVCIVDPGDNCPPYIMVNPRIVESSSETSKAIEGCLSLPGVEFPVHRANWVDVTFSTWTNESVKLRLTGLRARITQHEIDHLDGKLFVSRLSDADKARARKTLARMRKASTGKTT